MALTKQNKQILVFYANKPTDEKQCPITAKYLKWCEREKLIEKNKGVKSDYAHMVNTFLQKNSEKSYCSNDPEENEIYELLQNGDGGFESIKILLDADKTFPVLLKKEKLPDENGFYNVEIQKWHLFVSWAALNEFRGKNGRFGFRCKELTIWLYETAENEKERLVNFRRKIDELVEGQTDWESIKDEFNFYTRIMEIINQSELQKRRNGLL